MRAILLVLLASGLCLSAACRSREAVRLSLEAPTQTIVADGRSRIELPLLARDGGRVELAGVAATQGGGRGHGSVALADHPARVVYTSGVLPGPARISVRRGGRTLAELTIDVRASTGDRVGDGLPDWMRLDSAQDRANFRRWFTLLAEREAREGAPSNAEVADCAGLLRYCLREALRRHDGVWARERGFAGEPMPEDVAKYEYPYTPLGARLLRVRAGAFAPGDENDGAFAEFADARTLLERNAYFVSKRMSAAMPGDILFYRRLDGDSYHSMIYVGAGRAGAGRWIVYHTGPDHGWRGELRRVALDDLLRHPDASWRPVADNPNFLGVYRWKLLRGDD